MHAGIAHLMFCLFFSVAYRAMAVPRVRRKNDASEPAKTGGLGT